MSRLLRQHIVYHWFGQGWATWAQGRALLFMVQREFMTRDQPNLESDAQNNFSSESALF